MTRGRPAALVAGDEVEPGAVLADPDPVAEVPAEHLEAADVVVRVEEPEIGAERSRPTSFSDRLTDPSHGRRGHTYMSSSYGDVHGEQ